MVGDKNKTTRQQQDNNLAELEASLAPAEAEVGAMAKADQNYPYKVILSQDIRNNWRLRDKDMKKEQNVEWILVQVY